MSEPITRFISRWQEYTWLLTVFAAAVIAYYVIPAIDPRAGIDGWGDLFHALVNTIKGIGAVALAWLCKSHFWHELERDDEARMANHLEHDASSYRATLTTLLLDRLGWLFWLAFWAWVLFVR